MRIGVTPPPAASCPAPPGLPDRHRAHGDSDRDGRSAPPWERGRAERARRSASASRHPPPAPHRPVGLADSAGSAQRWMIRPPRPARRRGGRLKSMNDRDPASRITSAVRTVSSVGDRTRREGVIVGQDATRSCAGPRSTTGASSISRGLADRRRRPATTTRRRRRGAAVRHRAGVGPQRHLCRDRAGSSTNLVARDGAQRHRRGALDQVLRQAR